METKIKLEPFAIARAKELFDLYNLSKESWEKTAFKFDDIRQTVKFIRLRIMQAGNFSFFIINQETGEVVGAIEGINCYDENKVSICNYIIGTPFQRKGYCRQALALFEKFLEDLGYVSCVLYIDQENIASQKVAQYAGYIKINEFHIPEDELRVSEADKNICFDIFAKPLANYVPRKPTPE